jgi:hypothetical protein
MDEPRTLEDLSKGLEEVKRMDFKTKAEYDRFKDLGFKTKSQYDTFVKDLPQLLEFAFVGDADQVDELLKSSKKDIILLKALLRSSVKEYYDYTEKTVLHVAAEKGHDGVIGTLLKYIELLKRGKDDSHDSILNLTTFTADSKPDETALHLAAATTFGPPEKKDDIQIEEYKGPSTKAVLELLLTHGANPLRRNAAGQSAFCVARSRNTAVATAVFKQHAEKRRWEPPPAPIYYRLSVMTEPKKKPRILPSVCVEIIPSLQLLVGSDATSTTFTVCSLKSLLSKCIKEPEFLSWPNEGEHEESSLPILWLKFEVTPIPDPGENGAAATAEANKEKRLVLCRVNELPLTLSGLSPSSRYRVRVAAANALKNGHYGAWKDSAEPSSIEVRTLPRLCDFVRRCLRGLGAQHLPGA